MRTDGLLTTSILEIFIENIVDSYCCFFNSLVHCKFWPDRLGSNVGYMHVIRRKGDYLERIR